MARELLEDRDAEDLVAALLKHAFGNELDKSSYKEISEAHKTPAYGSKKLNIAMLSWTMQGSLSAVSRSFPSGLFSHTIL